MNKEYKYKNLEDFVEKNSWITFHNSTAVVTRLTSQREIFLANVIWNAARECENNDNSGKTD